MITSRRCALMVISFLGVVGHCQAGNQLAKEDIAKQGTAATLLLESRSHKIHATAFCVHPSGLFVTTEPAVRPLSQFGFVTLILNPGQKTQRVLSPRVVCSDPKLGLALLKCEGLNNLAALTIASEEKPADKTEVTAFGFPFDTAQVLDGRPAPAVSVSQGKISSVPRKKDEPQLLQLDTALRRASVGGPILDSSGKVVGVLIGPDEGGVNRAIPAGEVTRFLAEPFVDFVPPILGNASVTKQVLFRVWATPILNREKLLNVELVLKAGTGKEHKHPMTFQGEYFQAIAVPAPPEGTPMLRLAARFEAESLHCSTADRAFKAAGREVKFSEVRSVQLRPPRVVLRDGKTTLEGPITGLEAVEVRFGEQTVPLNLSKAVEVRFGLPAPPDTVAYTLLFQQDGKEVARRSGTITLHDAARVDPIDFGPIEARPPQLDSEKVVKPMPAPIGDVAVGGGGRFLIFHFPKVRQLGIFDLHEVRLVHYITLAEDEILFSAGKDKLVVVLPATHLIHRYSLQTFEREATAKLPFEGKARRAVMGSASSGPLLVGGDGALPMGGWALIDVETLKLMELQEKYKYEFSDKFEVRAAPTGNVFTYWMQVGGGRGSFVLQDKEFKHYQDGTGGYLMPSDDGRVLFGHAYVNRRGSTVAQV